MRLWYISFADDDGFLGATVIEAESPGKALSEATRRDINPGGEAKMIEVPPEHEADARRWLNRLVSQTEMLASGAVKEKDLSPQAKRQLANDSVIICQRCN